MEMTRIAQPGVWTANASWALRDSRWEAEQEGRRWTVLVMEPE